MTSGCKGVFAVGWERNQPVATLLSYCRPGEGRGPVTLALPQGCSTAESFRSLPGPSHFSLRAQRKVTQRKGAPRARFAGILPAKRAEGLRGFSTGLPTLTKNWSASCRPLFELSSIPPPPPGAPEERRASLRALGSSRRCASEERVARATPANSLATIYGAKKPPTLTPVVCSCAARDDTPPSAQQTCANAAQRHRSPPAAVRRFPTSWRRATTPIFDGRG